MGLLRRKLFRRYNIVIKSKEVHIGAPTNEVDVNTKQIANNLIIISTMTVTLVTAIHMNYVNFEEKKKKYNYKIK